LSKIAQTLIVDLFPAELPVGGSVVPWPNQRFPSLAGNPQQDLTSMTHHSSKLGEDGKTQPLGSGSSIFLGQGYRNLT